MRLNGVDLEGAGPGTVLAELTIEPVGDHSMDELEKQIYLDVYGSYDIEGVPLEWIKPFHAMSKPQFGGLRWHGMALVTARLKISR